MSWNNKEESFYCLCSRRPWHEAILGLCLVFCPLHIWINLTDTEGDTPHY